MTRHHKSSGVHFVHSYLTPEAVDSSNEDPSNLLFGSSITYRIAVGPQQGRKVLTLQTLPDYESDSLVFVAILACTR